MASMLISMPAIPAQAGSTGPGGGASAPSRPELPATAAIEPARLSRLNGEQDASTETGKDERGTVSGEALDRAVSRLQEYVQVVRRNLEFSIDETTDRLVVKVVDAETEEVVRQIPSEEALALARRLEELRAEQQGLLLSTEA